MLRIAIKAIPTSGKAGHLAADKADEKKAIKTYGARQQQHPELAPMYKEMQSDEMDHAANLTGAGAPDTGDNGAPDADEATGAGLFDGEKVPPQNAGYMGPENGPFMCSRCEFFDGQGSCKIVAGPIDPNGCCNMFTPEEQGPEEESTESPETESQEMESAEPPAEGAAGYGDTEKGVQ